MLRQAQHKRTLFAAIVCLAIQPAAAQTPVPTPYTRAVAAGYKALTLCSAMWNAGRTREQAEKLELRGTPMIYINGRHFELEQFNLLEDMPTWIELEIEQRTGKKVTPVKVDAAPEFGASSASPPPPSGSAAPPPAKKP